jgi:hypothetical protein
MKNSFLSLPLLPALGLALGLTGCSDANVDLQQQIAVLKDELEKAKSEKSKTAAQPPEEKPAKSSAPDQETLKQNYEVAGRALRAALEKELSGVQLESFTLYQPKLEPHPHRSEFSMEFKTGGVKFTLDRIPVKGALDGTWFFPSVDALMAQIERVKAVAQTEQTRALNTVSTPQTRSAPAPAPAQSGGRELSSPATANKTVSIEWDSQSSAPAPAAAPAGLQPPRVAPARPPMQEAPAPVPRPQEPSQSPSRPGTPNSVMPAQREVQIKF